MRSRAGSGRTPSRPRRRPSPAGPGWTWRAARTGRPRTATPGRPHRPAPGGPAAGRAGEHAAGEPADELARFGLTDREREVLLLLADGRSNPEIAQALFISPKTASVHVSNILAKLGVGGRVEAAAVVHRLGVIR